MKVTFVRSNLSVDPIDWVRYDSPLAVLASLLCIGYKFSMHGIVFFIIGILYAAPAAITTDPYCKSKTSLLIGRYLYGDELEFKTSQIRERMTSDKYTNINEFSSPARVFWMQQDLKMTATDPVSSTSSLFRFTQLGLRKEVELSQILNHKKRVVFYPALEGTGFKFSAYTNSQNFPADPIVFNFGEDCKLKSIFLHNPGGLTDAKNGCKEAPKDLYDKKIDPVQFPNSGCDGIYITADNCKKILNAPTKKGKLPVHGLPENRKDLVQFCTDQKASVSWAERIWDL